jgi:hypothetical protein
MLPSVAPADATGSETPKCAFTLPAFVILRVDYPSER